LEGFEVGAWGIEALKGESSGFNAADYGVASNRSGLRGSCLAKALLSGFVGDGRVFEGAFSVGLSAIERKTGDGIWSSTHVTSCRW